MSRWQRSIVLVRASWAVLREDKELLVLPLISGVTCLVLGLTFIVPVILTSETTATASGGDTRISPVGYGLLFLMYLVLAYITIFFKTALLCGADERMRGEDPTLGSSLSAAADHTTKILPWAVISATVSMLLRGLEQRAGFVGRIAIALVGVAWAAVTFLVLPVLVFEGVGVGEAIKRSGTMLKQTWGENLIVNFGIGLVAFMAMLPAVVVGAAGVASGSTSVLLGTVVLAIAWVIIVSCWSSAMTAVFQLALYRYATDTEMPPQFATVDMGHAFVERGAR